MNCFLMNIIYRRDLVDWFKLKVIFFTYLHKYKILLVVLRKKIALVRSN
jgi:hypothetical protein